MNYYLGEFKAAQISLNKVQEIKSHKLSKMSMTRILIQVRYITNPLKTGTPGNIEILKTK